MKTEMTFSDADNPAVDSVRPLVTLALLSFNQENYIQKAIEGALSQDYSPLEIIISDDHSSDKTFEIIESMTANYSGIHRVMVRRNEKNLGISQHVNSIYKSSLGKFIAIAAGDDISYPDRVSRLVNCILKNKASLASSAVDVVDENGLIIGYEPAHPDNLMGCSLIIHRDLIDLFPKPIQGMHTEDAMLINRAKLLNGSACCDETLLAYRVHDSNASLGLAMRKQNAKRKVVSIVTAYRSKAALKLQELIDASWINRESRNEDLSVLNNDLVNLYLIEKIAHGGFLSGMAALCLAPKSLGSKVFFSCFLLRWAPFLHRTLRIIKK